MVNEIIGNCYQIVEKIGEGGMGEVFRGVDINLDRDVAIKVMRRELASRPEILQRFRKEAVVLAKLNHSNIATLYNFIHDGSNYFMVMEFAPGQTLDHLIDDHVGGVPWRYALELFMDALRAIDYAHKQGIIHRDIKPANMMVSERGTLKVLDFGIARVLGESGFTKAGIVVGTTKYMSPEQILGRSIDTRSDIYALGIVLYKMLTGHVPFEGLGEFELMKAQVEQRPIPVSQIIPDVPPAIETAILRSLEKAPEDRFQKGAEFIAALVPMLRDDVATWESRQAITRDLEPGPRANWPRGRQGLVTDGNLARQQADMPTSSSRAGLTEHSGEILPPSLPPRPAPPVQAPGPRLEVVRTPPAAGASESQIATRVLDTKLAAPAGPRPLAAAPDRASSADDAFWTKAEPARAPEPSKIAVAEKPVVQPSPSWGARLGKAIRAASEWLARIGWWRIAGAASAVVVLVVIALAVREMLRPPDPEEIAAWRAQAKQALFAGKVLGSGDDTAIAWARKVLKWVPDDGEAKEVLIGAYALLIASGRSALEQEGDVAEAKARLEEARTLAGESALDERKLDRRAAAALADGIAAEESRRAALENEQRERAARERRIAELLAAARAGLASKQFTEAAARAQDLLGLVPDHAEARRLLDGALQGALEAMEEALARADLAAAGEREKEARALAEQYGLPVARLDDLARTRAREADRQAKEKERAMAEQRVREERAVRVAGLLEKAQAAAAASRWTAPPDDNVVGHARAILGLEPENSEALRLIGSAVNAVVHDADAALEAGDAATAKARRDLAAKLAADYPVPSQSVAKLSERITEAERRVSEATEKKAALALREAQIKDRVDKAMRAIAQDRLAAPAIDNAVQHLRDLIELAPENADVQRLSSALRDRYVALADKAVAGADFDKARELERQAGAIATEFGPSVAPIRDLTARIEAAERGRATALIEAREKAERAKAEGERLAKAAEEQGRAERERSERENLAKAQDQKARAERDKAERLAKQKAEDERGRAEREKQERALAARAEEERVETARRAQALADLRKKAKSALAGNRLTSPSGDNAVELAGKMLTLDNGRNEGLQILQEVVGRYVAMGEVAVGAEDLSGADGHFRAAERIVKNYRLSDTELRRLDRRLTQKKQELAELERRARDDRKRTVTPPPLVVSPRVEPPRAEEEKQKVFVPPSF